MSRISGGALPWSARSGTCHNGRGMRLCRTGSPGTLEELDDIGDPADRSWIFHRWYLLQDCLGQRRKIALMDPDVAQAHRTAQVADEPAHGLDGGPGCLLCGHL